MARRRELWRWIACRLLWRSARPPRRLPRSESKPNPAPIRTPARQQSAEPPLVQRWRMCGAGSVAPSRSRPRPGSPPVMVLARPTCCSAASRRLPGRRRRRRRRLGTTPRAPRWLGGARARPLPPPPSLSNRARVLRRPRQLRGKGLMRRSADVGANPPRTVTAGRLRVTPWEGPDTCIMPV